MGFWSCSLFCDYATCWVFFFFFLVGWFNLGMLEFSEYVYMAVKHSDSGEYEKSDSSRSDSISDEKQRSENEPEGAEDKEGAQMGKKPSAVNRKAQTAEASGDGRGAESMSPASEKVDPRSV